MRWQPILLLLSIVGEAVAIVGWSGVLSSYSSRLSAQAQMAIGNTPVLHLFWAVLGVASLAGLLVGWAGLRSTDERSLEPPRRSARWRERGSRGRHGPHFIDFS